MNNLVEKLENITIKEDLFKDVTYFVTGELQPKVVALLDGGGASTAKYMVSHVTHLICGKNFSEDVINEAADLYEVPVVHENWVLSSALLGHLTTLKPYYPLANKLFSKFIGAIVNVSLKDRKTLHALITYNGGVVRKNFDGSVNFLVCGAAKGPVYGKAVQLKNGIQIVTPDWVTNSLKCKSLISAAGFHPRLVVGVPKTNPQTIVRQMSDNSSSSLKTIIGFESNESDGQKQPIQQQQHNQQMIQNVSQMVTATSVKITQSPQSKIVQLGGVGGPPLPQQQQHQQPQIFQRSQSQPQFHQINQQNKIILQQQNIQVQKADHMQAINPNLMHHTNIQMQRQQTQPNPQAQHDAVTGGGDLPQQQPTQNQQLIPANSTIIVNQQQINQLTNQPVGTNTGLPQQQQQQHQMMTTQKFIVATSSQSAAAGVVPSVTGGGGPSGVGGGGVVAGGQQNQIIQNHMLSQQQKQHILQNLMLNQQPNAQGGGGLNKPGGSTQIQIIQTSKGTTINQIQQPLQQQQQSGQQQVKNTMIIHNQQLNVSQNVMQQIQQQQQQNPNQNIIVHQQHQQMNKNQQQLQQQQQPPPQQQQHHNMLNKQLMLNQPGGGGQPNQQQPPTQQIVVINQNIGPTVSGAVQMQQIGGGNNPGHHTQIMTQQQQPHPQMQQQQHLIQQQGGNQQQLIQNQQHHMAQTSTMVGGGAHALQQQQKVIMQQQTNSQIGQQQQGNQQNPSGQQQQPNQQQRLQYLHNLQQQQLHQQQNVMSQQQGQQQNIQISQNIQQIPGQIIQQQQQIGGGGPQNSQQQIIVHQQNIQQPQQQNVQQQHQSPQANQQQHQSPQANQQQTSMMQQQQVVQPQQPSVMQVNNQQQQIISGSGAGGGSGVGGGGIPQPMTQQQQAMQQMNYQLAQQQQKILSQQQQQQQQIISQQQQQQPSNQPIQGGGGTTPGQGGSSVGPDGTQNVNQQQIIQNHQIIQQPPQIAGQQQSGGQQGGVGGGGVQQVLQQQTGNQQIVPQSPQHIQQSNQTAIPIQNQIVVQNNQLVGGPQVVGGQQAGQNSQHILTAQTGQQWTPQSPVHGQQQPQPGQQFIRAARPAWVPGPPGTQRQVHQVHVDAQTHNHLQTLDPMRRAIYISKIQNKQRNSLMFRPTVASYQTRPGAPGGPNIVGTPRPGQTQHIVIRSQVPPGLIQQQQQVQLLQQQGGRPILVRPGTAPGLSPISQQVIGGQGPQTVVGPGGGGQGSSTAQFAVDPNATPQQQQQQLLIQRQQQYQRLQQLQLQRDQAIKQQQQGQAVSPRGFNPDEMITPPIGQSPNQPTTPVTPSPLNTVVASQQQLLPGQQQQMIVQDATGQAVQNSMNSKTKTALANMLSNRLNNNGVVVPAVDGGGPVGVGGGGVVSGGGGSGGGGGVGGNVNPAVVNAEPSAAGTLRLMTQQHNAALNPVARTPQEIAALQQQQNQRRTLGNITNSAGMGTQAVGGSGGGQMTPGGGGPGNVPIAVPQTPPGSIKGPPFSPGRAPPMQRSQFYGHNPNLKLPSELFLLGCIFFIVEYDESHVKELNDWKELIRKHGGEIETTYCSKVTHVLCRSQRHGVVMQAIRDSKRCVTAYWLSDTILKKQVIPPWQALHLPTPSTFGATQKPATRHIVSVTGFEGEERNRIKLMISEAGAKFTDYLSKHNTVLICKKLDGPKYKYAKENNMPVVNASWLSDILLGNLSTMAQYESAKYQQYSVPGPFRIDYTLVPHLMTAWKSPINLTQESHERVKRSLLESTPAVKPKKMRTLPPLEAVPDEIVCSEQPDPNDVPKVIFSQVDNLDGLRKVVIALGGIVVTEPTQATHLVMTRLTRTIKLLTCLCCVKCIASSDWLVESARSGKFLPADNYRIENPEFERQFKCDISKTVKQSTRNKLFEGKIFYLTPTIFPPVKNVQQLIELCGGVTEKVRRSSVRIQEALKQNPNSYIIISCLDDLHLVADLAKLPKSNQIICTTEVVMKSIMTQTINFDDHMIIM